MGLFGLFESAAERKRREEAQRARREDMDLYPGMRMEITTEDDRLFLAAELVELRGDHAKLKPFMDGDLLTRSDAPVPVTMRGRSSKRNGAVVVEATVRGGPNGIWHAEHLALVKWVDDRASFRIDVDLAATAVPVGRPDGPEEPCRLLNIGTGGARISMSSRRNVGDKFLMWVKLPPEMELSGLVCQIVRINERRYDHFEYGCRFLYMEPSDEDLVLRAIFDVQKHK